MFRLRPKKPPYRLRSPRASDRPAPAGETVPDVPSLAGYTIDELRTEQLARLIRFDELHPQQVAHLIRTLTRSRG